MASTQRLRAQIKSVRSTRQITKAMEMVSASKLRRAQEAALRSRQFATLSQELLTRIRQLTDVSVHPLFQRRDVRHRLIIVVASDGTLAGGYNANVLKFFATELRKDRENGVVNQVITVGKQATNFCAKIEDVDVVGAYHDFVDKPTAEDLRPILVTALDGFLNESYDAVDIVYTDFVSSVNQKPSIARILPAAFEDVSLPAHLENAPFEPSPKKVLLEVTERFVEVQMMQYMLESAASEHSSRMLAMKNASDNADDLLESYTLAMNTARQAAITQELAEISGGVEALNG